MLTLAIDENFRGEVVRGLLRRRPDLDLVRTQDVGLRGADDPTVLEWAATEGRLLLSHDRATMPAYAYDRVRAGQPMPGLCVVEDHLPTGQAIEEILLLATCSEAAEWENIVLYLPL